MTGVRRCLEEGRFSPADPYALALQLWSTAHGVMALQLSGLLDPDVARDTLDAAWRNLCVAFGDDRRRTDRSLARARRSSTSIGVG